MYNNSNFLFFMFMLFGVIFTFSSNNWILMWCGMELSLICFIPMILNNKYFSSESCMKYFIVQSLSSFILVLSILMIFMNLNFDFILIISLMMKMGVSPFHNWVLSVVLGLNYYIVFFMFSLLKLSPLLIISYTNLVLIPFIMLTLFFGSLFGLNQNSLMKIISYSSIFNMGFILTCIHFNNIWLMYLFFYSFMLLMLMFILNFFNVFYINQVIINNYSFCCKFIIFINMLSMGGMPPTLGFSIKLIVFELMLYLNFHFLLFIMVLLSFFVMYFYIRLSFLSLMIYSSIFKYDLFNFNLMHLLVLIFNLLILPFLFLLKYFY